jgi:hypothetical protein
MMTVRVSVSVTVIVLRREEGRDGSSHKPKSRPPASIFMFVPSREVLIPILGSAHGQQRSKAGKEPALMTDEGLCDE